MKVVDTCRLAEKGVVSQTGVALATNKGHVFLQILNIVEVGRKDVCHLFKTGAQ